MINIEHAGVLWVTLLTVQNSRVLIAKIPDHKLAAQRNRDEAGTLNTQTK